jgi:hypothetical protein
MMVRTRLRHTKAIPLRPPAGSESALAVPEGVLSPQLRTKLRTKLCARLEPSAPRLRESA